MLRSHENQQMKESCGVRVFILLNKPSVGKHGDTQHFGAGSGMASVSPHWSLRSLSADCSFAFALPAKKLWHLSAGEP